MSAILRFPAPPAGASPRRWFAGLLLRPRTSELAAALVATEGRGFAANVVEVQCAGAEAPRATTVCPSPGGGASTEALLEQRRNVAEAAAQLVAELLHRAGLPVGRVAALGLHDAVAWRFEQGRATGCFGGCDPDGLAELTGISVVDDLPARDLACGGLGGPILALGEWLLLRDANRDRLHLDLGRTLRLSYLPAQRQGDAPTSNWSYQVGPGMALLDMLAERLTGGRQTFDPSGSMAVQGQCIGELLDHWLRDPVYERRAPHWHPVGVRGERFLSEALPLAVQSDWAVRDLLCTATHLLAESVRRAIARHLPPDAPVQQLVVSGGGQHNGMLLSEIVRRCDLPLARATEVARCGDSLEPAATALLAMLHIDQTPGNLPSLTGAEVSRVLGRLTPGAPLHWQRLVQAMAGVEPAARSLRSAL